MKKIKLIIFAALMPFMLLFLDSCTKDFEDINKDPNNPSTDLAAPDMLLTNAIESMTDRVHEIFLGHEMGSGWVQQMAKVQYTDEDRYIPRLSVINNTWTSFYAASGKDIQVMYDVAVKRKHSNYQGVALVMKCYISSVLTDLFGPIPYTDAWKGETNTLPKYDSQEFIYKDMVAKLAQANTLLDVDGSEISGDILFGGDILKWKKFANSLRMRLLLRMSDKVDPTTELTAMVADPTTYPIFADNGDNAALAYLGSSPNNHPINENRKTRDDHRVSKNFIDLVLNNYGDYRIMVFAKPSAGNNDFEGMPNGLTSSDAAAYLGNGLANTCKMGDYFTAANAPGMLMSYAELNFILAEAAARGFIPGGLATAKTYYDAGITASFDQFSVPMQEIFDAHSGSSYGGLSISAAYKVADELTWHLTDPTAPAYFDAATITNAKALQLIAEQRYIATFDQGLQSWFEWRRTDFPVLTPAASGVNGGKIPVRVYYPSDEASRNPANLAKGKALLGGADDLNTKVWWDIK